MVLRTELRTASGRVVLSDFMPLHADDKHNDIGRHSPAAIGRVVEGIEGSVELDVEIAVRPEYGLTTPLVSEDAGGLWHTRGGPIRATIATDVELEPERGVLRARFLVRAGEHRSFALNVTDPWREAPPMPSSAGVIAARDDTIDGWQSWATKLVGYEGDHRDLLRRSAVVLRALNYAPTGAIVAAPDDVAARGDRRRAQLGLPLHVGARRQLHHRCPRRQRVRRSRRRPTSTSSPTPPPAASQSARGCRSCTASAASASSRSTSWWRCRVTVTAGRCASATARGTRRSSTSTASCWTRPCRCRSSTSTSIAEYGAFLAERRRPGRAPLEDVDEGIWEVRGGAGHFLYSKLMNWVALDRAVKLAPVTRRGRGARRQLDRRPRPASAPPSSIEGWSDDRRARTRRPSGATSSTRRC